MAVWLLHDGVVYAARLVHGCVVWLQAALARWLFFGDESAFTSYDVPFDLALCSERVTDRSPGYVDKSVVLSVACRMCIV